jgi:hypothetical protein
MAMNCVDDVDTILGRMSLPRSDLGMMGFGKSEKLKLINQLRHDLQSLQQVVDLIREHMIPEIVRGLGDVKAESRSFATEKAHGATEAMHKELTKLRTEIFSPSTLMSVSLLHTPLEIRLQKMVRESSNQNRARFNTLLDASFSKLAYTVNAMDGELEQLKQEQKRQAVAILDLYELVRQVNQRIPKA